MIELAILAYLIGGSAILIRASQEIRQVRPEITLKSSLWLDLIFFMFIFICNPIIWILVYFSTRNERKKLAKS